MEHLENHPHAIIKNGVVVWCGVFVEHDDEGLFQNMVSMMNGDKLECCCNLGYEVSVGWHWDSVNQVYYQLPDEQIDPTIYYGWSPDMYPETGGYHEYILNRVVE